MSQEAQYYYLMGNRGTYFMPKCVGYTSFMSKAGVYTHEKAMQEVEQSNGDITAIPIDIDEHNRNIVNQIEFMKDNIIVPKKTLRQNIAELLEGYNSEMAKLKHIKSTRANKASAKTANMIYATKVHDMEEFTQHLTRILEDSSN